MGGGAWWAAIHGVAKSRTRLSDFTFTFHFHTVEKEMATRSSVLAWRIPGNGGAWWAAIYGVAQSRTRLKCLSSKHGLPSFFNSYAKCIMRNAGLEEAQAGIKIAGRNTNSSSLSS